MNRSLRSKRNLQVVPRVTESTATNEARGKCKVSPMGKPSSAQEVLAKQSSSAPGEGLLGRILDYLDSTAGQVGFA